MARRSPPVVNQTYETGCTWRLFGIFNFREGHFIRRLVSSSKHLNTDATAAGNGKSRRSSDVLRKVDEKYPHIGVSSRRSDYGCKSISCVENNPVVDHRNEGKKMTVDGRFVNKNFQGKDGAGCQANQLLDALQILYSNKELFLKLLQDPDSLLVKQIHDFPSFQVKEPYQAMVKRMTRLNKVQNSNARQCAQPCKSSLSYERQYSNRIVALKHGTINVKNFADTSFGYPWPNSPSGFSYSAQNIKPSHFSFGRIKRKLRYVAKVRRKEQQWMTSNGVPCKFSRGSQHLEDAKMVKELETSGRNSLTNVNASIEKGLYTSLDLKKSHKIIKVNDSELCTRQEEAASSGESCSRNTNNTSSSSKEDILNLHVEGRKSPAETLDFGTKECKQCIDSLGRTTPLHDNLQVLSSDISIRKSLGENLHAHYDLPRDDGSWDNSTQNFDINNATRAVGSLQDPNPEIQNLSFSPEVASPSSSSSPRIEDNINMRNIVEQPSTEFVEQFASDDVPNSPITIFQPDESRLQVTQGIFDKNHFAEQILSSLGPINSLTSSKDNLDYLRETLQALSLNWDELVMKIESSDQMLHPFTFDELKQLTRPLSGDRILLDCVIETSMEVYRNYGFLPHISAKSPNIQSHVVKSVLIKEISKLVNMHFLPHPSSMTLKQLVEKDLARRRSWLNIQVGVEDIAMEVGEHVLEKLVFEIIS